MFIKAAEKVLIVDDEANLRRVTQVQLEEYGYDVAVAADGTEALTLLEKVHYDLVIADLIMPGLSGLELLKRIHAAYPEVVVIIVTAYASVESAIEAMKFGAYDYITKPINPEALRLTIGRALEHLHLLKEVESLRSGADRKHGFADIIGHSKSLLHVLDTAARAAETDLSVLIRGETGTGKELLAKGIHLHSTRGTKPFVTINCGAIPKELLESELFGHLKGAFTGALTHKIGKVETADHGTLFLDEIGDLPLDLQVKILRLVQEHEIEKIGATCPTSVDVRIIAATHRNLTAMIEEGTFREDLYYRLAVIPLELQPLRERRADIPLLVHHLLAKSKQKLGKPNLVLPEALVPCFSAHRWPGNVRELENVIDRMVALCTGDQVTLDDLPELLRRVRPDDTLYLDLPHSGIRLETVERELLLRALEKFNWNQTQAARYLAMSRKTLIYRMRKHRLLETKQDLPVGHQALP